MSTRSLPGATRWACKPAPAAASKSHPSRSQRETGIADMAKDRGWLSGLAGNATHSGAPERKMRSTGRDQRQTQWRRLSLRYPLRKALPREWYYRDDENQHKRTLGRPHPYGPPCSDLDRGWRESRAVLQRCRVAWRGAPARHRTPHFITKTQIPRARAKIGLMRSLPKSHQAFDAEEDPRRRAPYPATPAKPARG